MTEQLYKDCEDDIQFQSAMRSMVVVSIILFKAGYFLGLTKCFLIPEKVMTYLGIECDSLRTRFTVPEERISKYLPLLQTLGERKSVTYSELEQIVGKLVSLECAVPAGMWYTREQYSALRGAGISPEAKKAVKNHTSSLVSQQRKEEWGMWIHFLTENK